MTTGGELQGEKPVRDVQAGVPLGHFEWKEKSLCGDWNTSPSVTGRGRFLSRVEMTKVRGGRNDKEKRLQ